MIAGLSSVRIISLAKARIDNYPNSVVAKEPIAGSHKNACAGKN
jgi:hypothetical protein